MSRTDFSRLPADAQVWIFGAERDLDVQERGVLLETVDRFLDGWKAHGAPLTAARELRHDRFLMVAVDPATVPPSGCSIDAMVSALKHLEGQLHIDLVGNGPVFYRDRSAQVKRAGRAEFRRLAEAGEVGPDTVVFDTTLTRMGRVREGAFERPAKDSWHRRAFFERPG